MTIKFIDAQQAKEIYRFKNTKKKYCIGQRQPSDTTKYAERNNG